MALAELPNDVQLEVLSRLDYSSLLKMSKTNKHFHALVTVNKSLVREALIASEEHSIATYQENYIHGLHGPRWNCYQCLRRLPDYHFCESDIDAKAASEEGCADFYCIPLVWLRSCVTCSYATRLGGISQIFYVRQKFRRTYNPSHVPAEWMFCGEGKIATRWSENNRIELVCGKMCHDCFHSLTPERREELYKVVAHEVTTRRKRFERDENNLCEKDDSSPLEAT